MMSPRANELFLTGATGFLGHYLLAGILRRLQTPVRILVRDDGRPDESRLIQLVGELGIDLQSFVDRRRVRFVRGRLPDSFDPSSLQGVDTVLHAAGHTAFAAKTDGEPHRTNVDGTAILLEAAAKHGVRHFMQISTAYVCGDTTGRIAETFSAEPPPFCNAYEQSKWEAERSVIQWSNADRVGTICRPSILFGDSETGRTTSATGVYLVARATETLSRAAEGGDATDRHAIPLRILGRSTATCNLVPVDLAAQRIVSIMMDPAQHGRVHHITNGDPPTHAEIKRWLEEYFDIGGGQFSNEQWPLKEPNHYEELFYALGNIVHDYFRDGLVFASRTESANGTPDRLVKREDFLRSLRYAQERNWGRAWPTRSRTSHAILREDVDPQWYFERHLVDTIPRSCVARIPNLTVVVQYSVDAPPNEWTCTFEKGRLTQVERSNGGAPAEFRFHISRSAFTRLVTGQCSPQQVFLEGQADIHGNVERALRMVPIMAEYIAEFPAPTNGTSR